MIITFAAVSVFILAITATILIGAVQGLEDLVHENVLDLLMIVGFICLILMIIFAIVGMIAIQFGAVL